MEARSSPWRATRWCRCPWAHTRSTSTPSHSVGMTTGPSRHHDAGSPGPGGRGSGRTCTPGGTRRGWRRTAPPRAHPGSDPAGTRAHWRSGPSRIPYPSSNRALERRRSPSWAANTPRSDDSIGLPDVVVRHVEVGAPGRRGNRRVDGVRTATAPPEPPVWRPSPRRTGSRHGPGSSRPRSGARCDRP